MRVMVLALLLANALFFMWSTWVAEPPVEVAPRQAGGETELTLLAELDNAPVEESDGAGDNTGQSAALEPMLDAPEDVDIEQAADGNAAQAAAPESSDGEGIAIEPEAAPEEVIAEVIAASDEPAEDIQVALADVPVRCASLGPFPDLREASGAASRLRANGFEPRQRLAEENMWVGHWVYLPSYPSRDAAVAAVEELREAGVNDIYIEPRGDRENAVSLGLFSDRENAELYAGQVRQYDVRPEITDRYRVGSAYWLDIELPTGQTPDPATYQRDEARKLRLELRDCDATGVAERDEGD